MSVPAPHPELQRRLVTGLSDCLRSMRERMGAEGFEELCRGLGDPGPDSAITAGTRIARSSAGVPLNTIAGVSQ